MISQFRDKKSILRRKRIIRTFVWSIVCIALFVSGFVIWSAGILHRMTEPLWKAKNVAIETVLDSTEIVRTKASVFRENKNLVDENTNLKIKMTNYDLVVQENTLLKELLGRIPSNHSFILAVILAKPNQSPYDTVIIDIGNIDGIKEGQKVLARGEIPVGFISAVYETTSLVTLYSNPGQTTEAVLDGSNATVTLLGRGGGNFEMSIPIDLPSDKGSHVILPALSSEVIAVVEDIISLPTDPLKKVLLRSPINIQGEKWLQVKK